MLSITKQRKPGRAEGLIILSLTDPITGKIKEQYKYKNHVFEDMLFAGPSYNWAAALNNSAFSTLVLNDSIAPIDPNMPFILGQTLGYGLPSTIASGTIRGTYDTTKQILGSYTPEKATWCFAYEFTTAQSNGTIGTVGLTSQYYRSPVKNFLSGYGQTNWNSQSLNTYMSDGRFVYICSTSGIITIYDLWAYTTATIDKSVTVGTNGSDGKIIGYNPANKHYYIYVYSSTAARRYMYEFSNNTFSTLLASYPITTATFTSTTSVPFYVYGNIAYLFYGTTVYIINFGTNTFTTSTLTIINAAATHMGYGSLGDLTQGCMPLTDKIILCGWGYNASQGILFDLETASIIGNVLTPNRAYYPSCALPISNVTVPAITSATGTPWFTSGAVAAKKLDTPITKTSADGLSVQYQIDIYWE